MSAVSGAGIAIALDNFRFAMAPTSYIELTGDNSTIPAGWSRGDARYYGLSMTGLGPGTDWFGSGTGGGCNANAVVADLGCPVGINNADDFAPVYNPFMLRVFQYTGVDRDGNSLTGANRPTILEFIAPSKSDAWRWAFWGELEVGRDGNHTFGAGHADATFLQSQSIIVGRPSTKDGRPAVFQLMRTRDSSDETLGIIYHSRLSGDFRFSVNQTAQSPDGLHQVPDFGDTEGMYFRNVDAYLPLGQLHYQSIVLSGNGTDGNFTIELPRIPDVPAVYQEFYSDPDAKGYVHWGEPGVYNTPGDSVDQGIFFVDPAGNVTNLGTAYVDGLQLNHLKITSLGAGAP